MVNPYPLLPHPWMPDWSVQRQTEWAKLRQRIMEYSRGVGWGLTPEQFGSQLRVNNGETNEMSFL